MNTQELTEICDEAQRLINISRTAFPVIMEAEAKIKSYFFYYYPHCAKIIAQVPTRADFAPIRALKTGKWDKEIYNDEGRTFVRYQATTDCGVHIDCRVSELPPSCRVVREEVLIPASEERTVIMERVICDPSNAEEALASK